jgi:hypothetical protein
VKVKPSSVHRPGPSIDASSIIEGHLTRPKALRSSITRRMAHNPTLPLI